MPTDSLDKRLDDLEPRIQLLTEDLDDCRQKLIVSTAVGAANTKRIEKLTHHIAELQKKGSPFPPDTSDDRVAPPEMTIRPKPDTAPQDPSLPS